MFWRLCSFASMQEQQCRPFPHGRTAWDQFCSFNIEEQPHPVDEHPHGQISLRTSLVANRRSIRLVRPLDCFARDIRPCGMRRTPDVTQSHFWRTPSLNVLRFRCQVEYVVRPQCHPDFIKLRARRPCSPCWACLRRRQRNPMTSTRKCEFSSSRISCGSSPARMRSCNTATGSSKIA